MSPAANPVPANPTPQTISSLVCESFVGLSEQPDRNVVLLALRVLEERAKNLSRTERVALKFEAIEQLKAVGVAPDEARSLTTACLQERAASKPDREKGSAMSLADVEPWPEPVDGSALLDAIVTTISAHVVLPEWAAESVALWILTTYCLDHAPVAVRLLLTSATRECGKTRLLSVIAALVRKPITASSITPAALFRSIEEFEPTILIDEVDNARLGENAELRSMLNSGHTRAAAFAVRTVGENHDPHKFSTWCAIVLAGIGKLPDTITSRSIQVHLRRKLPGERVQRLRESRLHDELDHVRRKLARWATDFGPAIAEADPSLPPGVDGRAADNWGVLVSLADAAGGLWPEISRRACAASATSAADQGHDNLGEMLLADVKALFEQKGVDRISSASLVADLVSLEDRPWPEFRDARPITKTNVARLLKPFGIRPGTVRFSEGPLKGYLRESFEDAFLRHLPEHPEQAERRATGAGNAEIRNPEQGAHVPDREFEVEPRKEGSVPGVSLGAGRAGERSICAICGGSRFWRPRIGSDLVCEGCHPPPHRNAGHERLLDAREEHARHGDLSNNSAEPFTDSAEGVQP